MLLFKLLKEVALINEQKFLAELGKLLTFMYEEDRQTAIELYAEMFASTADEHALMLFLGSPTRQAVQVARAYNAKERKLQVHSQSKNEDGLEYDPDEVPDFVLAINKIALSAAQITGTAAGEDEREAPEGQFSLFDEGSAEAEPAVEEAPAEEEAAASVAEQPAEEVEEAPVEEPAAAVAEEAPAEEPVAEKAPEGAPAEEATQEAPAEDAAAEPAEADSAPVEEPVPAENEPAEEKALEDDFVVVIPELQEAADTPADVPVEAAVPAEEDKPADPAPTELRRKPRVFLLILFIILAVPVTLIGVALLLIPTLLSLSLALSFIVVGVAALVSAFAGFAVFADILVMLGIALIGLALGLLFLWLFVWFIGGAIVGLVKSVIALGASWCYKEVPAV